MPCSLEAAREASLNCIEQGMASNYTILTFARFTHIFVKRVSFRSGIRKYMSEIFSDTVEGLAQCDILPPRNLFHPVLPFEISHCVARTVRR